MSSKPENQFIASVHRHLPPLIPDEPGKPYREKMYNPLRGGTWDVWYSGSKADWWIEYKFVVLPKRLSTEIKFELSELQMQWGKNRIAEGRNLAVIIGCRDGGVILHDKRWEYPMECGDFKDMLLDRKAIADHIIDLTQGI